MVKLEECAEMQRKTFVNAEIESLDGEVGDDYAVDDNDEDEADDILSQVSLDSKASTVSLPLTSKRMDLLRPIVKVEANLSHVLAVL